MPKHLFLCRHAESLPAVAGQKDFTRELSQTGEKEAFQAASWIAQFKVPITEIHCSAASRTTQTANILVQYLNSGHIQLFTHESLYNASAKTILNFIEKLNPEVAGVALFLHNPGVS